MKLNELNEAFAKKTYGPDTPPEETIDVVIGFDDHMSTYAVPRSVLTQLARLEDMDGMVDTIIDHEYVNNSGEGEIFLDTTTPDVGDFKQQIANILYP